MKFKNGLAVLLFCLCSFASYGKSPSLFEAIVQGDLTKVRTALKEGADPEALNEYGYPALHVAVGFYHLDIAQVLLDHGADINRETTHNWTPLNVAACRTVDFSAVQWLVEKGANVNQVVSYYGSPLKCAMTKLSNLEAYMNSKNLDREVYDTFAQNVSDLKQSIIPLLVTEGAKVASVLRNGSILVMQDSRDPEVLGKWAKATFKYDEGVLKVGIIHPDGKMSEMQCDGAFKSLDDCEVTPLGAAPRSNEEVTRKPTGFDVYIIHPDGKMSEMQCDRGFKSLNECRIIPL